MLCLSIDKVSGSEFIDLGAEQLFAAERHGQKIAVEVKSSVGRSDVDDLERALGQ